MDNTEAQLPLENNTEPATPAESVFVYPGKPELEEGNNKTNVWIRSMSSLALYLAVGYFFFHQNWSLVLVLTGVVVFHELGHFFAMKLYDYKDLGIFFIPLVGAYASGTKHEVSQRQSVIIILGGPLPGIIAGIILYFLPAYNEYAIIQQVTWILIYLNLLNLLPIYPLDGGQLLNRLWLDEYHIISKIFIVISSGFLAYFAWKLNFLPLLIFPAMLLWRMWGEMRLDKLTLKIEAEGIDLNTTYDEISDEQYWKTREVLIRIHPDLHDIPQAPPYEYADKEEKVITTMQSLLQRTLIMDQSVIEKILVLLIWAACFLIPTWLHLPLRLF